MNIVHMSIQAGMLIIATVFVRAIALYRLPKMSFLAFWGIVIARMLIPFSLASRWSIFNILDALLRPVGWTGAAPTDTTPTIVWGSQIQATAPMLSGNASKPSATMPSATSISTLEAVWIGGMVVLFIVFAVMLTKSYWMLRSTTPVTNINFIAQWRSTHQLRRPLEIVKSDKVTSPASLGILRPRIIFPQQMDLDDEQLIHFILVHEYFHIRRMDMLWKLLALCAVCIHWFNPLAWVMLFLLNRDLELSCDEMVLRHFGGTDRAAYAHSLIDMAEQNHSFSIASHFSKSAVEERIIAVMKYKKSSLLALALVFALAVGMTTAFATSTTNEDDGSQNQVGQLPMSPSWDILKDSELTGITMGDCPMEIALDGSVSVKGPGQQESPGNGSEEELAKIWEYAETQDINLVMVNPENESKFTPDEWAKIQEGIKNGTIRWEDSEPTPNTVADCGNPVLVNSLTGESEANAIKERTASFEYNKQKTEGKAATDIAPGDEMPVGTVNVGIGQSITVSLLCDTASKIEVGIKKPLVAGTVSSEKLVVDEANGAATIVFPVEERGEYVLYVKNVGANNTSFSLSYLVH